MLNEATNTNFIVFGLTRLGLEPTFYCTWGEHANHYTNDICILYITFILAIFEKDVSAIKIKSFTFYRENARLQIRLPDGSSLTNVFPSSDTLQSVHNFVSEVSYFPLQFSDLTTWWLICYISPLDKSPLTKSPPNNELYKLFIYLYLCTHFGLIILLAIYGLKLFLNTIFHNKLLLELEDIMNNWNMCLRIIITLIKESKNEIIKLFFL